MFEKETKFQFHTAFVPVVKTQSLKSEHLFCTLKCLMKKVCIFLVIVNLSTAYLKSLKKTFK